VSERVTEFAGLFRDASAGGRPALRPSESWPEFTLADAYAIQREQVSMWESAGETVAAVKLGLTQTSQQEQFGIPHPTFGTLTDRALLKPGQPFSHSRGYAPKVEAELVVVLGKDITHPPTHPDDIRESIATIHAGIEILDSRFRDGMFQPLDGVADNQSALSGVWSDEGVAPELIDMAQESVVLTIDGEVKASGDGSRILGNPLLAVHGAVVEMLRRGFTVPAGLAIFTGNLCDQAVEVAAGNTVTVEFSTLGTLSVTIVP
jgi:2-oxo-3-hexenedioate decarboxylase